MEIAVLGWGSLIWKPLNLKVKGSWKTGGLLLPIEFARISEDGSLTLVLFPDSDNVQTLWVFSSFEDLDQAIENLRRRERTSRKRIGFISIPDGSSNCQVVPQVLDRIRQLAKEKELNAVIWTDLPSNFKEKARMDFNEDNVIKYLKSLTGKQLEEAEKYVRRVPKQVKTRIRSRIETELGWTYEFI